MARTFGSPMRANRKDRVAHLKRFLSRAKRYLGRHGCPVCGREFNQRGFQFRHVYDPGPGRFPVGNAPYEKGMTFDRMKMEMRRTRLLCRQCAVGMLYGITGQEKELWGEQVHWRDVREDQLDLDRWLPRDVCAFLRENTKVKIKINNTLYFRGEEGELWT